MIAVVRPGTNEVAGAGGGESDGGGAVGVGAYGASGVAVGVVIFVYFIHRMGKTVIEHCKLKQNYWSLIWSYEN